ncbi:histidine phosphatase family protein [Roseospira marina]|uniref:Histidine phosphatase family protein n=1 Tax=Roseospira marina TaxID=140057 RepID=A0A5M6IFP6_9PROT|nr:histidine phosphatase family protein [Roseospira marina]KAA5606952.1 histidine phosphatase family protein [Roseospira marina]MBB4312872.1 putative phosphoglycerate mutase [Roseospira marina]MBB5086355.1 putative phosphoglycerate mutase [Roseospira marina]
MRGTDAAMHSGTQRRLLDGPFYFMRHGESTTNADSLVAGLLDAHLTETGHHQAAIAAEAFHGIDLAGVVVTGLYRTHQTAMPILRQKGLAPFVEPGLNERDWGALEGRSLSERPSTFYDPPGGETWEDFTDRIWRTAQNLVVPVPTLVVAHSGTFRALLCGMGFGKVRPPVHNAMPVRFEPLDPPPSDGGPAWTVLHMDGSPVPIKPPKE